jgi:hypothetical protein
LTPLQCEHITDWSTTDDESRGRYSHRERHPSQEPEPLKLQSRKYEPPPAPKQAKAKPRDRSPEKWLGTETYASSRALQQGIRCSPSPRRTQSNAEPMRHHAVMYTEQPPPMPAMPTRAEAIASIESPLFSPLACYFRGPDFPSEKKGGKTMIGDNGWLERTQSVQQGKRSPSKRIGILEGIKKIAKDMVSSTQRRRFSTRVLTVCRLSCIIRTVERSPWLGSLGLRSRFHWMLVSRVSCTVSLSITSPTL